MPTHASFAERIDLLARGLRDQAPHHLHLNRAASQVDGLGRRLHGLELPRADQIAACFAAAIAELDAAHHHPEDARGAAVDRVVGHLDAARAHVLEDAPVAG